VRQVRQTHRAHRTQASFFADDSAPVCQLYADDDTEVANDSAPVCQLYADDDTEVANDSAHVCQLDADDITDEIDVFGDEDVYLCGEVGCWKDSG